jgi:hypothetical protein
MLPGYALLVHVSNSGDPRTELSVSCYSNRSDLILYQFLFIPG